MSILSKALSWLSNLLFARTCPICGEPLPSDGPPICPLCEMLAPLTNFHLAEQNPMVTQFWGLMPLHHASAMVWYIHGSGWQRAIHDIKYHRGFHLARELGEWWAVQLAQSEFYRDIDAIVPVPLHWRRRLSRGYNQSEYLADGLAKGLGVSVIRNAVRRSRYNSSQTFHSSTERWDNVEGIFRVTRPELLRGKHLLLVDDVFTTGATIISLGNAILASAEGVTLSVATLSVSRSRFDKIR